MVGNMLPEGRRWDSLTHENYEEEMTVGWWGQQALRDPTVP